MHTQVLHLEFVLKQQLEHPCPKHRVLAFEPEILVLLVTTAALHNNLSSHPLATAAAAGWFLRVWVLSRATEAPLGWQDFRLDERLRLPVFGHEAHVAQVHDEQAHGLPPHDGLPVPISEEPSHHRQSHHVPHAVAEERPPRELQQLFAEDGAAPNHEQHVEHRGADDGADAHVRAIERADEAGEELWCGAPRRHQGGPRHVVPYVVPLLDHFERGHKVLVAHNRQGTEHVHNATRQHDDLQAGHLQGGARAVVAVVVVVIAL
mmetsp:Transcript_62514/g.125221  ORF Transcript_62514/g.125221 Transcript_62514/m.125221 type:complete len:263 (-) Transcript_62514:277-1065(-)